MSLTPSQQLLAELAAAAAKLAAIIERGPADNSAKILRLARPFALLQVKLVELKQAGGDSAIWSGWSLDASAAGLDICRAAEEIEVALIHGGVEQATVKRLADAGRELLAIVATEPTTGGAKTKTPTAKVLEVVPATHCYGGKPDGEELTVEVCCRILERGEDTVRVKCVKGREKFGRRKYFYAWESVTEYAENFSVKIGVEARS